MSNDKFVIIVDMTTGNESVGTMWKKTGIFQGNASLNEVMDWVRKDRFCSAAKELRFNIENIIVTVPQNTDGG